MSRERRRCPRGVNRIVEREKRRRPMDWNMNIDGKKEMTKGWEQ